MVFIIFSCYVRLFHVKHFFGNLSQIFLYSSQPSAEGRRQRYECGAVSFVVLVVLPCDPFCGYHVQASRAVLVQELFFLYVLLAECEKVMLAVRVLQDMVACGLGRHRPHVDLLFVPRPADLYAIPAFFRRGDREADAVIAFFLPKSDKLIRRVIRYLGLDRGILRGIRRGAGSSRREHGSHRRRKKQFSCKLLHPFH